MGTWESAHWESSLDSAVPRTARRSGEYERYAPDALVGLALGIDGGVAQRVTTVERAIRALSADGGSRLAGVARFLLRSEAIASSRIEGISPSAQQVALAELGQSESVRGVSEHARLVANNMTIVRQATTELVEFDLLTVDHIVRLHQVLLPDEPRHHGLRTVQNWIGGSDWTPIGAAFVPPGHERVELLMTDLVDYLNGSAHSPLIQAAVIHAQFETIHPFTDGNGRVGRALIHTVLARRALTGNAIVPISLVLSTLREQYVDGLTAYRHDATAGSPEANRAINGWLDIFVRAAGVAVERAEILMQHIDALQGEWTERLTSHRTSVGVRATPRADSAVARLLALLPEAPVVTARTLASILDVSFPAARAALEELRDAGILHPKSIDRGATAYVAREILDLITLVERALASTKFDTSASPPNRPVPAKPMF
jgi:Fic family protein